MVVVVIDTDAYSSDYPREVWNRLERGVPIRFEAYGLIHYTEAEQDLEFVARDPGT